MENSFFLLFILADHLNTFYNVFECLAFDPLNKAIKEPFAFKISVPVFACPTSLINPLDKLNHLSYNATGCT
jgi:hypothetical protein